MHHPSQHGRNGRKLEKFNVLPTSGPELACYLVHLLQTTKSIASIQVTAFGVAWADQKSCLPSPLRHTTAAQVEGLVLRSGGGNPGEL